MVVQELIANLQFLLGTVVEVQGKLFVSKLRCWIVDDGCVMDLGSRAAGVLIKQPGLATELFRYALLRVGGPIAIADEVTVVGTLDAASVPPYPAMLTELVSMTAIIRGATSPVRIQLAGIDRPSQGEIESVERGGYSAADKAKLMQRYETDRAAW